MEMTAKATHRTNPSSFNGPAGRIEAFVDAPHGHIKGIAVVAHPHPLIGGNAEHKIPATLARLFQRHGWLAVRPNFRGVGGTEGQHDKGIGETEDLLAVIEALRHEHPGVPLALAGFSFGAFVHAHVAQRLVEAGAPPACTILVGIPSGQVKAQRFYDTPAAPHDTLVIHGEKDEVVDLSAVLDWARPQRLPVVVLPGANHFLTGSFNAFTATVERHLASFS
jgi:alpha/beta superfamily hydrolase